MNFDRLMAGMVILAVIAALATIGVVREIRAHRRRQARLSQRSIVSTDDWIRCYSNWTRVPAHEATTKVLDFIAEQYGVAPTQILPADRFSGELACDCWLFHGDGALEDIHEEFPHCFNMPWNKRWLNVADVVEAVNENFGEAYPNPVRRKEIIK